MREGHNNVIYRSDYQAPAFWIDNVDLTFDLDPAKTRVLNKMKVRRNADVTEEFNAIHRMWTTFWPLLMLSVHVTTVLVWLLAVPRLLGDGPPLSTGVFVSFLLYTTMFIAPIEEIGQLARTVNRATSSAHRVFEVLDSEPEVRSLLTAAP